VFVPLYVGTAKEFLMKNVMTGTLTAEDAWLIAQKQLTGIAVLEETLLIQMFANQFVETH